MTRTAIQIEITHFYVTLYCHFIISYSVLYNISWITMQQICQWSWK